MQRYGVESPAQLSSVREKTKKTCLERYGEDNPFKSETIKARIKETCVAKYGVENPQQLQEIRSKSEQTCIERYGAATPFQASSCREKARETCVERYGVEYPMQSAAIQEKTKKTCLEKYGVEYQISSEVVRQKSNNTLRENYGVDNPMKSDIIKERLRNTWEKKHGPGIINPSQVKAVQIKIKETSRTRYGVSHFTQSETVKRKLRLSMTKKYGYDCAFKIPAIKVLSHSPEAHKKRIETMKSTGADFQSSKIEDALFEILLAHFANVERHVPVNGWDIDFYVADIDAYINMNGIYWHGRDASEDQLKDSLTKQSKTILGTKLRDMKREIWFKQNGKKLIIIWEDEISLAIQKIVDSVAEIDC